MTPQLTAEDRLKARIAAQALALPRETLNKLADRVTALADKYGPAALERITDEIERVVFAVSSDVREAINELLFSGYLGGQKKAFDMIGAREITKRFGPPGSGTLPPLKTLFGFDAPKISLPTIDNAVANLLSRNVTDASDYYRLARTARERAFTISGQLTQNTLEKLHASLTENVRSGADRETWVRQARGIVESLPLSDAHLEQVFRNNVNEAFAAGNEEILSHPLVEDAFPYRIYYPIRDSRARHEHIELETLGLNGTAVYYYRDPTWLKFRPPWSWNCRCGYTSLSIQDAASYGVREAQEWLRTGNEPFHQPVPSPPFEPDPRWRREVGVAA